MFDPEDTDTAVLQYVTNPVGNDTLSHSRRLENSSVISLNKTESMSISYVGEKTT